MRLAFAALALPPMPRILAPLALLALPLSPIATAQDAVAPLNLEQRMLLRCSAAFATVAQGQANGDAAAFAYPDLRERGQEFFVRASAQVMDEAGLDRARLAEVLTTEAQDIRDSGTLAQVMPACLSLLPET